MGRPSPRASRGEGPVRSTKGVGQKGPARLARRVRLLWWLGGAFHAGTAAVAVGFALLFAGFVYLLTQGAWPSFQQFGPGFLTGSTWDAVHGIYGAGPPIAGTLVTSAIALLIAVPLALGVAVFLSEVAPVWLRRPLVYVIDLSAAVPSVVYGFWAFIVLVPIMRTTVEPGLASLTGGRYPFSSITLGTDIFTASLVLAVMILPTIAAVSREALRAVPRIHRESALSLGATRWEATRLGVFGPARNGIAAGIILGLGRALGETIAVAMLIGNGFAVPATLFSPGSTLASQLINNFPESPGGLNRAALFELALILLVITFAVNAVARGILWRADVAQRTGRPSLLARWRGRGRLHRPLSGSRGGGISDRVSTSALPAGLSTESPAWFRDALAGAPRRIVRRRVVQAIIVGLCGVCVILAVAPLVSVVYTAVEYGGVAVVHPSFYTSLAPQGCNPRPGIACPLGGIGNEIQGSLIILGIAGAVAVPVGLLAGVYLAEYGRNRFGRAVSFVSDVMTGVPTVILGVFVFTLFLIFDHGSTISALSCGVGLGVLMIPIATRATEESLRAVPYALRESAFALGFPRHRTTLRVVLGCARGGIVTGMLLALSRAAGDTAILVILGGSSNFWFQSLTTGPTAAMTPFIWDNFGSSYLNLYTDAWGTALVLLAVMLVISLGTRLAVPAVEEAAEAE